MRGRWHPRRDDLAPEVTTQRGKAGPEAKPGSSSRRGVFVLKRTPIKRRTPLKRTGRIRPRNPERAERRRAEDFGPLAEHARGLPCAACGAPAPSDPAHVKSRGAGGHARLDNGDGNIIPLCRPCHTKQHAQGWGSIFADGRREAELRARAVGESARVQSVERS